MLQGYVGVLLDTWMSQEVRNSMVRINGLFHLLIDGAYLGVSNPLILTSCDIQVLVGISNISPFKWV